MKFGLINEKQNPNPLRNDFAERREFLLEKLSITNVQTMVVATPNENDPQKVINPEGLNLFGHYYRDVASRYWKTVPLVEE